LNTCRFSEPCEAAINEANYSNANFHIMAGGAVTLVVSSVETFSWRYGILIDSGGLLGGSLFDVAWDGMGTLMIPAQAACMRSRTTSLVAGAGADGLSQLLLWLLILAFARSSMLFSI
jgi:hypothetical protein